MVIRLMEKNDSRDIFSFVNRKKNNKNNNNNKNNKNNKNKYNLEVMAIDMYELVNIPNDILTNSKKYPKNKFSNNNSIFIYEKRETLFR